MVHISDFLVLESLFFTKGYENKKKYNKCSLTDKYKYCFKQFLRDKSHWHATRSPENEFRSLMEPTKRNEKCISSSKEWI